MTEVLAANGGGEEKQAAAAERLTGMLEAAFNKVERERMRDVPILNTALRVTALGMRPFGSAWVCALVTPWFINLMLLPGNAAEAASWNRIPQGTKSKHPFAAGIFEFIHGSEDGLGPYQMCSLFSPVLEFENHEAAVATAAAALDALFDASLNPEAEQPEPPSAWKANAPQMSRRDLFLGDKSTRA